MKKETANEKRQAYAESNPDEDPIALVIRDQMKEAGAFVRDYDTAYCPSRFQPDADHYIDVELGWAMVAQFIHNQICRTDDRKALQRLTLGDLASFYARAAGGLHDPLDPDDNR